MSAFASLHCTSITTGDAGTSTAEALKKRGDDTGDDTSTIVLNCYADKDGDGYPGTKVSVTVTGSCGIYSLYSTDCDDRNPAITLGPICYRDADGDGHGSGAPFHSCGGCGAGTSTTNDDCDDSQAAVWQTQYCSSATDADGDGYAAGANVCAIACPTAGRDGRFGDCNDNDANIHPETREVSSNLIDDDCNGLIDEARPIYVSDTSLVATDSVWVQWTFNDAEQLAWINGQHALIVVADYSKLTDTSTSYHYGPSVARIEWQADGTPIGSMFIPNLEQSEIYRIYLRFFHDIAQTQPFTTKGSFTRLELGANATTNSAAYFTATLFAGQDAVASARPQVVIRALHEWNDSQNGLILDGNRYCTVYNCNPESTVGYKWCSKFYNWVLAPWFVSLDPYPAGVYIPYDVGDVIGKFSSYRNYYADPINLPYFRPGDFLAEGDVSGGPAHHSSMFVGLDSDGHPWQLAGNVSNRVYFGKMREQNFESEIRGAGSLAANMLR